MLQCVAACCSVLQCIIRYLLRTGSVHIFTKPYILLITQYLAYISLYSLVSVAPGAGRIVWIGV